MHAQDDVDAEMLLHWESLSAKLLSGMPLQYALGKAWFMDMTLQVTPDVLIPRPETEEMVEIVITENRHPHPRILDVGTGSGCIALALQKYIPGAQVIGIDISVAAVQLARRNADATGIPATFDHIDIFDENTVHTLPVFDLIISNPPYIHPDDKTLIHSNVLDYEPHLALFTPAENPFIFYERISDIARVRLRGNLWFEISADTGVQVAEIMRRNGFQKIRMMQDMQGKQRFVTGVMD